MIRKSTPPPPIFTGQPLKVLFFCVWLPLLDDKGCGRVDVYDSILGSLGPIKAN